MAKPADQHDQLIEAQDRFIASWGQMAGAWGISRTMAEAHALLYITGRPMNTDEIMDRLQISRGNASMSIRALLDWGIISRTHKRGDRKEYFEAEKDVWKIFITISKERKRREIEPAIRLLRDCAAQTKDETIGPGRDFHQQMKDLDEFPTPDDNPDFYVDYGETGPYEAVVGESECAA